MDRRTQHIEAARARLAHLAGVAAKTDKAEHTILASAQDRLEAVTRDLETLRPRVNLDQGAADRYMELTQERGTLATVIAQAQHHVGMAA
jgi:hypothetical protein